MDESDWSAVDPAGYWKAKYEESARDAERYRWLRLHSYVERSQLSDIAICYGVGYTQERPDFLDDDIDKCMARWNEIFPERTTVTVDASHE